MNNRVAKKIVKKYGSSWISMLYKDRTYEGDMFVIPRRWKDKNIEKWLMRNFYWHALTNFKKPPFIYIKRK